MYNKKPYFVLSNVTSFSKYDNIEEETKEIMDIIDGKIIEKYNIIFSDKFIILYNFLIY